MTQKTIDPKPPQVGDMVHMNPMKAYDSDLNMIGIVIESRDPYQFRIAWSDGIIGIFSIDLDNQAVCVVPQNAPEKFKKIG